MAGMEGLGRLFNAIPAGSGNAFKMRGASAVTVLAWNATGSTTTTATVTQDSTFGGSFSSGAYVIKNVYTSTALNGTAVWAKQTFNPGTAPWTGAAANNVNGPTGAITFNNAGQNFATALVVAFAIYTSELSDPNNYLKVTMTGAGAQCVLLLHDLVHQRAPANLEILSA